MILSLEWNLHANKFNNVNRMKNDPTVLNLEPSSQQSRFSILLSVISYILIYFISLFDLVYLTLLCWKMMLLKMSFRRMRLKNEALWIKINQLFNFIYHFTGDSSARHCITLVKHAPRTCWMPLQLVKCKPEGSSTVLVIKFLFSLSFTGKAGTSGDWEQNYACLLATVQVHCGKCR